VVVRFGRQMDAKTGIRALWTPNGLRSNPELGTARKAKWSATPWPRRRMFPRKSWRPLPLRSVYRSKLNRSRQELLNWRKSKRTNRRGASPSGRKPFSDLGRLCLIPDFIGGKQGESSGPRPAWYRVPNEQREHVQGVHVASVTR
jgi:hypothetical protein